jgi:hypothetical protein
LSTFTAIAPLSLPNTTLNLIFAAFYGSFEAPSEDLWFPAHQPIQLFVEGSGVVNGNMSNYAPDNPVSVLACLEQVQLCNPSLIQNPKNGQSASISHCTPSNSFTNITYADLDYMFTTERQKKIASALVPLLQRSTFANTMTSTQLLAESLVVPLSDSLPLAPDQWILETKNMYRIGLATVQRLMVDFITGPSAPYSNYVPKNQADNDTELDWLCRNQIIRRNDYSNFSSLSS